MKRAFLPVLILGLVMACKPAEQPVQPTPGNNNTTPTTPTTPTQPEQPSVFSFSATPSSLNFHGDGGTITFQLTTKAKWKAYTLDTWYTFSPTQGEGDTEITVTALANPDPAYGQRGTIDFEAQNGEGSFSFQLTQDKGEPGISVNVSTGDITDVTSSSAVVAGSYSGAPAVGVYERGVYYGTSSTAPDRKAALDSAPETAGSFTVNLIGLEPGTTYYVNAYVTAWDDKTQTYLDFFGSTQSFTTESTAAVSGLQYLSCYEMPAIALQDRNACSSSGKETWGSTNWYNYLTTDSEQQVVTHTYSYNGKPYRNWTALIDKGKKSPLWSAFVMHQDSYPDNNLGRSGNWTYDSGSKNNTDPGIPASWQRSVASSNYSRGHFVASDYRQASEDANWQTFYWTNQSLQWQNGFNGGIWATLENSVKANAPTGRDTLYVVVGILFENPNNIISTNQGSNELAASHFYKCLMKCSFDQSGQMTAAKGCAYIFENVAHSGKPDDSSGGKPKYRTSIDAIEQRAGWDFFTNVPKDLQDAAEAQTGSIW